MAKRKPKPIKFSSTMPPDLHADLKRYAEEHGLKIAYIVAEALSAYLVNKQVAA